MVKKKHEKHRNLGSQIASLLVLLLLEVVRRRPPKTCYYAHIWTFVRECVVVARARAGGTRMSLMWGRI